jgi:hypothetical protein
MKVGDLIKFTPEEDTLTIGDMKDRRRVGTILKIDTYRGKINLPEPILEVFWSTGALGWILQRRVELICEAS